MYSLSFFPNIVNGIYYFYFIWSVNHQIENPILIFLDNQTKQITSYEDEFNNKISSEYKTNLKID